MPRKSLARKLFPTYFLITLLSVLAVGFYALTALREFYYTEVQNDLLARARIVRNQIESQHLYPHHPDRLESLAKSVSRCCSTRVTVIAQDGRVIADSERDPSTMENHADRPEIRQALRASSGISRRRSPTLGITMIYAAVPIQGDGRAVGVIRVAQAATAVDEEPAVIYTRLAVIMAVVALLAAAFSLIAARRVTVPLTSLIKSAAPLAAGDLRKRVPAPDTSELAGLAEHLNSMAARLDEQVRSAGRRAKEQEAIMSSMREAVVAIDNDQRVLILNKAAERLLGIRMDAAKGQTIQEAVRSPALQRLFGQPMDAEEEIIIHGEQERLLRAAATALVDADGREIGALVVLDDVTQMHRLETVRRDFVANVSHELRTPITAIKGYVETLLDSSLDNEEQTRKFLAILARQAGRMQAIIDDLLSLAKIEQAAGESRIALSPSSICRVLEAAATDCQSKAQQFDARIVMECDPGLQAMMNSPLLEQAITNLLDNAIQYSPAGGEVRLSAKPAEDGTAISVSDDGPGIEPEHIPRLFERFYRVDKARSRKGGGTGLGLSIAKHIVQAHGGRIDVRSTPGAGSTFTIVLPPRND